MNENDYLANRRRLDTAKAVYDDIASGAPPYKRDDQLDHLVVGNVYWVMTIQYQFDTGLVASTKQRLSFQEIGEDDIPIFVDDDGNEYSSIVWHETEENIDSALAMIESFNSRLKN